MDKEDTKEVTGASSHDVADYDEEVHFLRMEMQGKEDELKRSFQQNKELELRLKIFEQELEIERLHEKIAKINTGGLSGRLLFDDGQQNQTKGDSTKSKLNMDLLKFKRYKSTKGQQGNESHPILGPAEGLAVQNGHQEITKKD